MKFPSDFKIRGKRLTLIPYKRSHVAKYHLWMESEELLRLTGSDRLTLEEEYAMQLDWERDSRKCTFIILDNSKFEESGSELASIVGDTNLFFPCESPPEEAEIEVMIAETWARRRGLAKESIQLMMEFGRTNLGKTRFIAKIKQDNLPSIELFSKLGYEKTSESKVFHEVTYQCDFQPLP